MPRTALMWFRRDLRIADNAALREACSLGDRVVSVFVPPAGRDPHAGGASALERVERSVACLAADLARAGCELEILSADAPDALLGAARRHDAAVVTCSRDWTPAGLAEEHAVASALRGAGVGLQVSEGQLLAAPGSVTTGAGTPFRVFTPFYRQWLTTVDFSAPEQVPDQLLGAVRAAGDSQRPGITSTPPAAGEAEAHARLAEFASAGLDNYDEAHDLPAVRGTSELSAALACGELSPRQVAWAAVEAVGADAAAPFVRQLAWREFAYHALADRPFMLDEPLRREFSAMPWREDPEALSAWSAGQTGWPLVDAGMRQLRETGWMHNRVRMVVASVLTKDLLVPWQDGAAVFERMLADYDPAANAFNWQWVAGSGADAAPYFRIFSPTLQATRFDPDGSYVRRWVPELAGLPSRWVHRPFEAPAAVLEDAGVVLGSDYPQPLIDHAEARRRALAAFSAVQANRS